MDNNTCSSHMGLDTRKPGARGCKSFHAQLKSSTRFIMLINIEMPTIVGILTLMSRINTTSDDW